MLKNLRFFTKYWPQIIIITIAILMRLINLENLFYFTYDESVPAFIGRRLILWKHIPLIGGVVAPFSFHLTPYFYWFLSALLFINKLNPLVWGVAGALFSAITVLLSFLVGKELFNKKTAFAAAAIWTFSYLANIFDRHFWALYWGPLISLATIFSLSKIIKGDRKYFFVLAFVFAWAFSADPSNIVFIVAAIIATVLFKVPIRKKACIAAGIFLLSLLPLLAFDLRHELANTKPLITRLTQKRDNTSIDSDKISNNILQFPRAFSRLIIPTPSQEIAKEYSYCTNYIKGRNSAVPMASIIIFSLVLIIFLYKSHKSESVEMKIASLILLVYFFGFEIYGTIFSADVFEHYISGLLPIFALIAAYFLSFLPKKVWFLALAIFVLLNITKILNAKNSIGLENERKAVEFTIANTSGKDFSLDSLSTCWRYSGDRYLFAALGKEPVKSYVDPQLSYLYGITPAASTHPDLVAVFVIHDFVPEAGSFYKKYALYKSHEVKNSIFGNIEVILMDNKSKWFN